MRRLLRERSGLMPRNSRSLILAKQFVALQECIVGEKLVQVIIATAKRFACIGFLMVVEAETALVL